MGIPFSLSRLLGCIIRVRAAENKSGSLHKCHGTSRNAASCHPEPQQGDGTMDKDRVEGSWEQAKGKAKEVAGKVTGDRKTEAEGKAQKTAAKVQNTVGGLKDTLRGDK